MNRNRLMEFYRRAERLGITDADADALRRIEMTLQRWAERECGDGSGCIERDEKTGKPFWRSAMSGRATAIADREKGALRRLGLIMARYPELVAYHQGDCRGCMLYVLRKSDVKPGEDISAVYTRGWGVAR